MLSGLLPPTTGTATVDGRSASERGPEFKRSIGVLPESLALFDDLTVEEHLVLTGGVYGLSRERTRDFRCQGSGLSSGGDAPGRFPLAADSMAGGMRRTGGGKCRFAAVESAEAMEILARVRDCRQLRADPAVGRSRRGCLPRQPDCAARQFPAVGDFNLLERPPAVRLKIYSSCIPPIRSARRETCRRRHHSRTPSTMFSVAQGSQ